jgi:hypothetical protein
MSLSVGDAEIASTVIGMVEGKGVPETIRPPQRVQTASPRLTIGIHFLRSPMPGGARAIVLDALGGMIERGYSHTHHNVSESVPLTEAP